MGTASGTWTSQLQPVEGTLSVGFGSGLLHSQNVQVAGRMLEQKNYSCQAETDALPQTLEILHGSVQLVIGILEPGCRAILQISDFWVGSDCLLDV